MTTSAREQRAVVLADWPRPTTLSEPQVLANDTTFSLLYATDDDCYAVVRFPLCSFFAFGTPNDEALAGHPLTRIGLQHFAVHEVHESALIRELERRNSVHPRHDPALWLSKRHLVFTFQDSTLECVVPSQLCWTPLVSVFKTLVEAKAAWQASSQPSSKET